MTRSDDSTRAGRLVVLVLLSIVLGACSTIPVDKRAPLRDEINKYTKETIAALLRDQPEIQKILDESEGYFAGRVSAIKAPAIGAGQGFGVLYDKKDLTRTYMNIKRIDLGFGLGTGTYRVLVIFKDRETLKKYKAGTLKTVLGAESVAGEKMMTTIADIDDGISLYILAETGAALVATGRMVELSVNEDLTDTGLSEVSIPNTRFREIDQQGEDSPRIWTHSLPFLAQRVIDLGYDLPLPYGVGITYVNNRQDMVLGELDVGINGRDKQPFKFVSFRDASAQNDSGQLKLDAWIFPFMNMFVLLGKVDGEAELDVDLDGNDMLDHLDITCGGFPPNPLCPALRDKTFTLPIETDFSGTTYGAGTILAGGWSNWFVTIPISFTYADMDSTDTDGIATSVTPRVGRVINLDKWGNLSLFGGGNYLDAELTVSGTVSTPDNSIVIDYTVEQENEDKWNLLLGWNWDINKRWSWSAEYNGFIGSREAVITSFTGRF